MSLLALGPLIILQTTNWKNTVGQIFQTMTILPITFIWNISGIIIFFLNIKGLFCKNLKYLQRSLLILNKSVIFLNILLINVNCRSNKSREALF